MTHTGNVSRRIRLDSAPKDRTNSILRHGTVFKRKNDFEAKAKHGSKTFGPGREKRCDVEKNE